MLRFRTINIIFVFSLVILVSYALIRPLPALVFMGLILAYLIILTYGSCVLSAQFYLEVKFKGPEGSNAIAITFDDGPHPGETEKLLDILSLHQVSAAFFCVGHRVTEHPGLVRRMHAAGHLLGNHSYWHGHFFDLQRTKQIERELRDTSAAIQKTIRMWPIFFRPPYGVINPMVAKAIVQGRYKAVGWSIRSFDLQLKNNDTLLRRVTKSLKGGDVILFHDRSQATLAILPAFFEHTSRLGLKIVRLDELLNETAYV
jgi:peptidoglycan-N-acetylglucosamine deacetylase